MIIFIKCWVLGKVQQNSSNFSMFFYILKKTKRSKKTWKQISLMNSWGFISPIQWRFKGWLFLQEFVLKWWKKQSNILLNDHFYPLLTVRGNIILVHACVFLSVALAFSTKLFNFRIQDYWIIQLMRICKLESTKLKKATTVYEPCNAKITITQSVLLILT